MIQLPLVQISSDTWVDPTEVTSVKLTSANPRYSSRAVVVRMRDGSFHMVECGTQDPDWFLGAIVGVVNIARTQP